VSPRWPGTRDTIRPRNAHLRRLLLASYVFAPLVAALNAQALFLHWRPGHSLEALVTMGLAAGLAATLLLLASWLPTPRFAARGDLDRQRYAWGNDLMPGGKAVANTWQGQCLSSDHGEDGYRGWPGRTRTETKRAQPLQANLSKGEGAARVRERAFR
jgi:hypothetical protein